jgi:hypothetical protein
MPFNLDQKLDTINEKPYTANKIENNKIIAPFDKIEPWPGFGPGTFALPRQRSTRLSYQGTDTERM